ncbi:hypothetical protein, conserved [Babesia ovata]|uniref:C3H1-type domain-containing protein n=1 Tax=Babesia ovata TaxID=189622 RepID=A0A2H6KJJ5_9APIC|nr:uncharacterized protein BOVATA_046510 [Babesia ovata]GBE63158.1 hypothetical protein, conserved [Babesia ovata]
MSFLHGVLQSVKDDDNVKKYDSYIKLTDNNYDLHTVLQNLHSSIGQGRSVFGEQVEKVEERTGAVKDKLGGQYYEEVSRRSRERLQDQLSEWKSTVSRIVREIDNVESYNVNLLDDTLRDKIMHEMRVVEKSVQVLKESVACKMLETQVRNVDNEIDYQEKQVIRKIEEQSANIQATLKNETDKIWNSIESMKDKRRERLNAIGGSLRDLQHFLNDGFNRNYKNKIIDVIDTIKKDVTRVFTDLSDRKARLDELVSTMQGTLNKLSSEFEGKVKDGARQDLGALQGEISGLDGKVKSESGFDNVVSKQLRLLEEAKKPLDKIAASKESGVVPEDGNLELRFHGVIYEPITKLVTNVETAIGKLYGVVTNGQAGEGKTNQKIELVITEIKNKVAAIRDGVLGPVGDGNDGMKKHWFDLREEIQRLVGQLYTNGKYGQSGHLGAIVDGIKRCADKFNEISFKNIVDGWVGDIFKAQPVKTHIENYVGSELHNVNRVEMGIKMQITGMASNVPRMPTSTESVADYLNHIHRVLADFAEKVNPNYGSSIAEQLHSRLRISTRADSQTHLTSAIRDTLSSVKLIANKLTEEIRKFMTESSIEKLKNAVADVQNIGKQFRNTNTSHGEKIDEAFSTVQPALKPLADNLNKATTHGSLFTNGTARTVDTWLGRVRDEVENLEKAFTEQVKSGLGPAVNRFNSNAIDRIQQAAKTAIRHAAQKVAAAHRKIDNGDQFNITGLGTKVKELQQQFDALKTYVMDNKQGTIDIKLQEIQTEVAAKLEKLQNVQDPGSVHAKIEEADGLMEQLRIDIRNRIDNIEQLVKDAEKVLINATDAVDKAVISARTTLTNTIQTLTNELLHVTKHAFDSVNRQIKSLFIEQHKADLSALHKLVERQAKKIKSIIDTDVTNGVKGLLNHMGTWLPHNKSPVIFKNLTYFSDVAVDSKYLLDALLSYTTEQVKTPGKTKGGQAPAQTQSQPQKPSDNLPPPGRVGHSGPTKPVDTSAPKNPNADYLETLKLHVDRLFGTLSMGRFSKTFASQREEFEMFLDTMNPLKFGGPCNPLLDILKEGFKPFLTELRRAYILAYDRAAYNFPWDQDSNSEKCAKVCLTLLSTLNSDLGRLRKKCSKDWYRFPIHRGDVTIIDRNTQPAQIKNPLGHFFQKCGYEVSDAAGRQNGHLRNEKKFTGEEVYKLVAGDSLSHVFRQHGEGPFDFLHEYLQDYYAVGHIATAFATKPPCSVYEMLLWCAGLTYNSVYSALLSSISEKLEEPDKPLGAADGLVAFDMKDTFLNTYPHKVTYANFYELLHHICSKSSSILTTILGFGDEHTMYACDFYDNSIKLYYPKSGAECLDTLLDILRRMFPPLRFLFFQCRVGESDYGWADCHFGKEITPAIWQCTNHSTSESNYKPKCQPTCQANGQSKCQPTSPLQSYLTDSLVGCLPHQLSGIGCKPKCTTCPKSLPGMPCLTPLGFRGFSGTTRKGEDLSNVLRNLFGDTYLASLFCLAPKAPSTLPEHFGFTLSLVNKWNDGGNHLIRDAFKKAIDDRSISLYEDASTLTTALSNAYGSSQSSHSSEKHQSTDPNTEENEPNKGDLSSLSMATACSGQLCAPYVYTLCSDYYTYLGKSHSKLYLSWAVYLPWSLWQYLELLYNAIKDIFCQDWGCRGCLRAETCRRGEHGLTNDKTKSANCHCESMVQCRGMMPTLYKYGFTFGAPAALNKENASKTCSNFCDQLRNVLHSTYFDKLFKECDNFLWKIREPFSITLLALWSLSLLYLLHIAVVRLDVLRIRSDLRSPSSHRIAAQSLLAAARVKALANVKYFSP